MVLLTFFPQLHPSTQGFYNVCHTKPHKVPFQYLNGNYYYMQISLMIMSITITFELKNTSLKHIFQGLMVLSDWQSVRGWNLVLKCKLVSITCCKLDQNFRVNLESLSDTIDTGAPYTLTILSMYNLANLSKVKVAFTSKNLVFFVSLSIITQVLSNPLDVQGSPNKNSMVTCFHFHSSTGSGFKNSATLCHSGLTCW